MNANRPFQRPPKWCLLLLLGGGLLGPSGCARLTFDRLPLGAGPGVVRDVLPAEDSRATDIGRACLLRSRTGSVDAIVLLVSRERRVAVRLLAHFASADERLRGGPAFRLTGEVDRRLYGVEQVPASDILRLIRSELLSSGGEKLVREAHGRVAVGLERLLASLPEPIAAEALAEDAGGGSPEIEDYRQQIPAGGSGSVVDEAGRLRVVFEGR